MNRPDHPQLERMLAAIVSLDEASDNGTSFAEVIGDIDLDSLAYVARQRALRAAMILAEPVDRNQQIMATWLDGFMAGVKFQQMGGGK